ncbi:MAG: MBL fold metallo-hydrolase [Gammaproteobacteria bacterium]|nr:MBL fold metallo-hydrolase [Gammaproteobacteria bacterium]MBP6053719.1 MBL fold metallo-hydrolase [Pseudomonadales bacterium]
MSGDFCEIIHHGAVRGVTGSCHELRLLPSSANRQFAILVDCGLFQGAETSGTGAGRDQLAIDFPIEHIRALVVTHVHIDHAGRIPYLLAAGFRGPIFCSEPSAVLLPLVIEDALAVGVTRERKIVADTVEALQSRIRPLPYGRWQRIETGTGTQLEIRLQRAGHILGSAYLECRISAPVEYSATRDGSGDAANAARSARRRVVFSGDLGAPHTPLLPAPRAPTGCDTLVIESTYGDQLHEGRAERIRKLQQVIERSLQNRGAVLIPAFSIGRTQELLYEIEDIIHRMRGTEAARGLPWNELEIVVDSPLAARFTRVYQKLKPFWDQEATARVRAGRHPLSFDQLRTVNSHADHLRIVEHLRRTRYPAIVIAASGMCAGGRILNYLRALIEDPATDILFVGYQAAGTPGHLIQRYGPGGGHVELDGQRFDIRASVHTLSGYSAHADQADLLRFATTMRKPPSTIRIVHGDNEAKEALGRQLALSLPGSKLLIPSA